MKKSVEIRQELAGLLGSQTTLVETAKTANRSLNEEETTSFNGLQTQILERKMALQTAEAYEENQRSFGPTGVSVLRNEAEGLGEQRNDAPKAAFSLNKAIRSVMNGGALEGAELEVHNATKAIAERSGIPISGICVPLFETRADGQGVTTDSGNYGAAFVATETGTVIDLLRPRPIVEKLGAVFLTNLQGDLLFPVNEGGIAATWEGEQDKVGNTKNYYGKKTMKPKRLAVSVAISLQNLMQSSQDMEAYTMKEIKSVIENAIDLAAINGTGVGQPLGLLNVTGTTTIAGGANGAVLDYANVVALETAIHVENASNAKLSYVSNPKVRGKLKTTAQVAGQPIYVMAPDGDVNGYPFETSNHIPSNLTKGTAVGTASAVIFGDFSQMIVGQWGFMDISVDNFSRKREGLIEITANVFVDVLIKQPKAFAIIKDVLTA